MSDDHVLPIRHLNKDTAVSLSLLGVVLTGIVGAVYSFAYNQGENKSRDKQIDKIEQRLERFEEKLDKLHLNVNTICRNTRGCEIKWNK